MRDKKVRVAAIQIDTQFGQVRANLEHAASMVQAAVQQGAELVLLPELMPCGYHLTEELWDFAEQAEGVTADWLTSLTRSLGIYAGTSFLEVEGEDFYNTFLLATPQGKIAGKVRKCPPASFEAYFYRAGSGSHVIETELGRIGVGICYENLLYDHLIEIQQAGVDLVLQPTAAGKPYPLRPGDVQAFDRMIDRTPLRYARALGAPAILANRAGAIHTPIPETTEVYDSRFAGHSSIVDGDGQVKARLGEEEGIIVVDVRLDGDRKRSQPLRRYGKRWAFPMPWYAEMWPLAQARGEQAYALNPRRVERARALSA